MTCPKAVPIFIAKTTDVLSTTTIDWPTLPLTVFLLESWAKPGLTGPRYCWFDQGWDIVAATNAQLLGADGAVGKESTATVLGKPICIDFPSPWLSLVTAPLQTSHWVPPC